MPHEEAQNPQQFYSTIFIQVSMYFFIFNNLWIQALLEINWRDQFWETIS